jgi:carbon-monoxide dehydrogenase medium subunit
MKPASFEYHRPDSLQQALELLNKYGPESKLLAGGQSLVPAMNFRVIQPGILIDINRISELDFVRQNQAALRLGAMTRERRLEMDTEVARSAPLLAETMPHVAHPQVRNRGTLGGSLSHADPAAELPVIMIALGARMRVQKLASDRWILAKDFFTGMFSTDLAPDEMLVEIELPLISPGTGWSFLEVAPRAGDYALMGVAAVVQLDEQGTCKDARLVFLNAGEGPVRAVKAEAQLTGVQLDEAAIQSAAQTASLEDINPFGNLHATPEFQRHLAGVLTVRALRQAAKRAGESRIQ